MNQVHNIPFLGLTHSPSDNICQDGELATCLGLINEQGTLIPINQPIEIEKFSLAAGDSIEFIHKVTHNSEIHSHYIIRDNNGLWSWHEKGEAGSFTMFDIDDDFKVNSVTAVGNILCFIGDISIKYAFWKAEKGSYILYDRNFFTYDVDIIYNGGVQIGTDYTKTELSDAFWDIFSYSFFGDESEGNYRVKGVGADKVINLFSAIDARMNEKASAAGSQYLKYYTFGIVAIRLYDGSYYNISNIFLPYEKVNTLGTIAFDADYKTVICDNTAHMPAFDILIRMPYLDKIIDLIQGVDVFLTKGEPFIDTSQPIKQSDITYKEDVNKMRKGQFNFHYMTPAKAKDTIDGMTFYKSISIDKNDLGKRATLKRVMGTEESISLANLFRSDIGGKVSITYNNRLHIANSSTIGNALKNTINTSVSDYEKYEIKEAIMKVESEGKEYWWKGNLIDIDKNFLCVPILYANRITLYVHTLGTSNYEFTSVSPFSSNTMDFSYYIAEDSKYGISFDMQMESCEQADWELFEKEYNQGKGNTVVSNLPSTVKVSEAENPLVFPAKNSVQVGSSIIYALSVNTRPISEGQFGYAPLYAFTDEGVWVLTPSDEGTYVTRQPASRDICSNPDAIIQIDDAVLFPTDRGILMQQGRTAQCITDVLDGYPFDYNQLINQNHAKQVLDTEGISPYNVQYVRFRTYLNNGLSKASLLYDYYDSRIIVFNPDYTYAYVYSLKSQCWGTMQSNIAKRVNSYPEALAISDVGDILNFYIQEPTEDVPYFVCTRPFTLSLPEVYKTIFTAILRGYVLPEKGKCGLVLYGSNDLHHWCVIRSSVAKSIRGICGSPYKYFRLAIIGSLSPDESLSGLSVEFQQRWQNKLR